MMTLNDAQIEWLNAYTAGIWNLNQKTGLVDIAGNFSCRHQGLTDFKGIKFGTITGYFSCRNNQLTSLEGSPVSVDGDFVCTHNQLTSLEGAPESVGGGFYCRYNQLTSLMGAPKSVGRYLYFAGNPVSERTILAICKIMKRRMSYTASLLQYWKQMPEEDKLLMYKGNPYLTDDKRRMYELMNRVKGISI
jgi:hypothetical protein